MSNTCTIIFQEGNPYFLEKGSTYPVTTNLVIPPSVRNLNFQIDTYVDRFLPNERRAVLKINTIDNLHQTGWQTTPFGNYDSITFLDVPDWVITWLLQRDKKPMEKGRAPALEPIFDKYGRNADFSGSRKEQNPFVEAPTKRYLPKEVFKIQVPIKLLRFTNGGICFDYKKVGGGVQELKVINEFIIEEFDAVKTYFGKALGKSKVEITITVEYQKYGPTEYFANSEDLNSISPEMILQIRGSVLAKHFKNNTLDIGQGPLFFSIDDNLDVDEGKKIPTRSLFKDQDDLFAELIKVKRPKHQDHLEFLANKQENEFAKLKYLLKPFSFVFLLKGGAGYFAVWETLDTSEATYLWNIGERSEDIELAIEDIQAMIFAIVTNTKTQFLKSKPDNFSRVRHDYNNGKAGLINWKEEIGRVLDGHSDWL